MNISPELLSAFADGELTGAEHDFVAAAVVIDMSLAAKLEAHRKLREKLALHFMPVVQEPVPDSILGLLNRDAQSKVVETIVTRTKRAITSRWLWAAVPAIAASLVVAVIFSSRSVSPDDALPSELTAALDHQLVSDKISGAPVKILLSFRNKSGEYCRVYTMDTTSGVACRIDNGWELRRIGQGRSEKHTQYRQANSEQIIMIAAQDMASGVALGPDEERSARAVGWR